MDCFTPISYRCVCMYVCTYIATDRLSVTKVQDSFGCVASYTRRGYVSVPEARPYIEVSDTRRFVYILRGLLCDVIGRLAPRAQLQRGRASNDVTPYHRTTVLPQQRVAEEVRWYPRSLLSWKFRGSPAAAQTEPTAAQVGPAAARLDR